LKDTDDKKKCDCNGEGLSLAEYTQFLNEIEEQPAWRSRADREMEYYAGNQLDSAVLEKQRQLGIPPAIEPLVGPTIDAVLGMEVKNRLDWRVLAEGDNDDVAQALSQELSQAERKSKADTACSEAYFGQICVGLGWVEVGRSQNPFDFPYRCRGINRNEIWWDWLSKELDLSDARYLVRRKWMDKRQAALMFPEQSQLINAAVGGWNNVDLSSWTNDGGGSTDLAMAHDIERGWSIEEMEWRDPSNNRVCLFETWYRRWVEAQIIKTPDGRVVEFDKENELHIQAYEMGILPIASAIIPKMRMSWWAGPHKLYDGPTPYKHQKYPYVPFFGKREDRTAAPFGLVRGMMYLQDEVNARIAKMQWGLSAVTTIRTEGAVLLSDDELHAEVGRPDADIVLDPAAMTNGGIFKIERNFELNRQQYDRLIDCREGIKRVGGIYNSYMGQDGQATSGVAINSLVEQSTQTLADINDNFRASRAAVGDLLLSLIIEDMAGEQKDIKVDATVSQPEKVVSLNMPAEAEGMKVLDNDIERMKLRVELTDVPSSPTFRTQQMQALSNAFANMPPNLQQIAMPHLLNLMDVPNKQEIIEAVKEASAAPSKEQIDEQIKQAVEQALTKAQIEQKDRELDIKEKIAVSQIEKLVAEKVTTAISAIYSSIQAGVEIATIPAVAPIADQILKSAGFVDANLPPIVDQGALVQQQPIMPPQDTSPMYPAQPQQPGVMPQEIPQEQMPSPEVGMTEGIEAQGSQL